MIQLPFKDSNDKYEINPSKILGLGLNYKDHINESKKLNVTGFTQEIPKEPILFSKTPNVLIGPEENIVIPKLLNVYNFEKVRVDYEAELAVIIKDKCKNVIAEDALNHILGYTCMNDVTERNIQSSEKAGWFRGKSFDTFGPIGPVIVKPEDIRNPQDLNITCRLNGKTVQQSNTRYMIFNIRQIISFASKNFTLFPGDIITTGTSSGVGPMKNGDVVEVEIQNIGVLKNYVVEE